MRRCTDKVAVRYYVAEKIGSEYLKPVLQIIPSLNYDCHIIARNNSILGDEAIQRKRSQNAVYENLEIKSNNQPDCHVATTRNDILSSVAICSVTERTYVRSSPTNFIIQIFHRPDFFTIVHNGKGFEWNKKQDK